jgi:hypothetical protein
MTCENPEHTFEFCQPQILPIYGGSDRFYNELAELALGSITVSKTVEAYEQYKYSSNTVSGGDLASEKVVQGSWMRPRYIDVDAILAGTPFEANLVAGFNLTKVGTYTISATEEGGLLVTLNYNFGVVANTATMVVFGNVKDGKSHSDVNGSNSNNGSGLYMAGIGANIVIPAADVAALATGGLQYFFLHSGIGSQTVTIDISDQYSDVEFDFVVLDANGDVVAEFSLKDGESQTVVDLTQGEYTVVETTTGWTTTYSVTDGKVNVIADEDTAVTVNNKIVTVTITVV